MSEYLYLFVWFFFNIGRKKLLTETIYCLIWKRKKSTENKNKLKSNRF